MRALKKCEYSTARKNAVLKIRAVNENKYFILRLPQKNVFSHTKKH